MSFIARKAFAVTLASEADASFTETELGSNPLEVRLNLELVLQELWVSFLGLFRSHLAALEISNQLRGATIKEISPGVLEVLFDAKLLTVQFDAQSGNGNWSLTGPTQAQTQGCWTLTEAAMVKFDEASVAIDMELAVEGFAAKLVE